jgi:prevent-host-death family protein
MADRIGVRELRQHASRWLERVEAGESFEVTSNGRPVARLVPIEADESVLERLVRTGQATRGTGRLTDLPEPLPPTPGVPLPSEILDELRRDER